MFQFVATALAVAALGFIALGALEAAAAGALITVAWVIVAHPGRPVPFSRPDPKQPSAILRTGP